jgi:hypothetical protein
VLGVEEEEKGCGDVVCLLFWFVLFLGWWFCPFPASCQATKSERKLE